MTHIHFRSNMFLNRFSWETVDLPTGTLTGASRSSHATRERRVRPPRKLCLTVTGGLAGGKPGDTISQAFEKERVQHADRPSVEPDKGFLCAS
jgi:hypothetical protein